MPEKKLLVRGEILNPISRSRYEYYKDGALVIAHGGRIELVGNYEDLKGIAENITIKDYSGCIILPGLVDTHVHLPQLPIRGKTSGTLMEWLNHYAFPVEEAFSNPVYAKKLSSNFFHCLKQHGTTTALVLSSVHEASTDIAFKEAAQSGMRIIMGKVMMNQNAPSALLETTKQSIDASLRLAQRWHGKNEDLLRYAFTPRFAISCSWDLLKAVGELQKDFPTSYIHSHLAENIDEIKKVQNLYPQYKSYTEVYEKSGCLGPRTVMAHGIYLSDNDLSLLKATNTKIAHCPTSNFFLKSGFFNIKEVQKHNICVGLGTDIGAGPDISIFRVTRSMNEVQLSYNGFIKPAEAFYYGTLGGAEALSLEQEIGNFMPGKSADFIVISKTECFEDKDDSSDELISKLVYLGDTFPLLKTFVRGKEI